MSCSKGIRAMSTITKIMKAGAVVCIAALTATTAAANHGTSSSDNDTVTVFVYEKGYFPNVVYLDGASKVKFVNKTNFRVGLDLTNSTVIVDSFRANESRTVNASYLEGRTMRAPYFEDYQFYVGRGEFKVQSGAAPLGF